ncbi:MAG TPA: HslU--HslV peptidase ATPase subunit [Spirochaetia bacterium]|nr:HslU--HslV peptidase ATPase subunit [Spirochaetia bacterium]
MIVDSVKIEDLTPKKVVELLDRYVIGQNNAKKAVAIALRNRLRRMRLQDDLRDEIAPKNILMIGPTGVGKTEIARRLARLVNAPFIKLEATKYTEVGYVGRDVESMIRDLTANGYSMVKKEIEELHEKAAEINVEEKILDILLPGLKAKLDTDPSSKSVWEKMREKLRNGELEEKEIKVKITSHEQGGGPILGVLSNMGMEDLEDQFQSMLGQMMPSRKKERNVKIKNAKKLLKAEELDLLIDHEKVKEETIKRVEQLGIVFIDEMDKIAGKERASSSADVSREGVQRDLLPIVEGTVVNTRYGQVKTDHILFIAAGAFHVSKPSDLIPEMQGRFPIRVELEDLKEEELKRVLTEPKNSLLKQYQALLETEGICLTLAEDAVNEIARYAASVNETTENIGARRLHTIMEKLIEDISFEAPDIQEKNIVIDKAYVVGKLKGMVENRDLAKYIL